MMSMSDPDPHQDFTLSRAFVLCADGPVDIRQEGAFLLACDSADRRARFFLTPGAPTTLEIVDALMPLDTAWRLVVAVLEHLFSNLPGLDRLLLKGEAWNHLRGQLAASGLDTIMPGDERPFVRSQMLWQIPDLWMPERRLVYPRHDIFNGRTFHPVRPPKPKGRLYARFIPWLRGTLAFDVATLDDLALIHRWMNLPRVNEFWREAGTNAHHRTYLETMFADPHIIPLIGRFEGHAFSYFEIYWAKEDLIGPFCDAGDYDRGCHVIVGEDDFRGKKWLTAWLPSLMHAIFLDDPRTERIIQEPDAGHLRQLANLQRSGFSHVMTVELPMKQAAIMSISRQNFFGGRFWIPRS